MKKRMELLAPAGGIDQLMAAVENGADAVYMGGRAFNARIKAHNFEDEAFKDAVDFAHLRSVKVYAVLNTLIKDDELLPALRYAVKLYNIGVDALILQDFGLASLVKEHLPDLPIHLSTQGTVYNLSGVTTAVELGFDRVILARETSLEEIQKITEADACDIEVFVHGALCMCYSGQCQMSRVLGGRSGNRGVCAQPCRLEYTNDKGKKSYLLSPKDLCMIDHIAELADAGVASLKIEGRMKSPEYVGIVTRIYRKYLDRYYREGAYTVSREDKQMLEQIFNRGAFTTGYFFENPGQALLSGALPKHQGVFIGKVASSKKIRDLIDVKTTGTLDMGDGIEIRSKTLTGNVVTYIKQIGDGRFRVGDIKGDVRTGDAVYRITKASLMKDIRKTYEGGKQYKKKVSVEMRLEVRIGQPPSLLLKCGHIEEKVLAEDILAEKALHTPLSTELAERQLKKTGGTPFHVSKVITDIQAESSVAISALNQLRRNALEGLQERILAVHRNCKIPETIGVCDLPRQKRLAFYFYGTEKIMNYHFKSKMKALNVVHARAYVPLRFYMENPMDIEGIEVIPYISNVSKGKLDQYIEENFQMIVERVKETGIAIGNLGWIREFRDAGARVYTDYGLNIYNEKAAGRFRQLGLEVCASSHEGSEDDIFPLMITEHRIMSSTLQDRKKQKYNIVYNKEQDKTFLFQKGNNIPMNIYQKRWKNTEGEMRIYIE